MYFKVLQRMAVGSSEMYYYATFKGKKVDLYRYDKRLLRRFNLKADVVNAQVQKAGKDTYVAVVTTDGRSYLYKSNGTLVRQ